MIAWPGRLRMHGAPGPRRRGRMRAAVSLVVVATLLLAGCASGGLQPESEARSSAVAPEVTTSAPELQRFYQQQLAWTSCGTDVECATLTVPLDWAAPEGDTIDVALARHRGRQSTGQALVMNPGGPGAPALQYVQDSRYRDYFFGQAVQRAFDIVTFDPRGVGASTAVRCTDDKQTDSYLFSLPAHPRGSAEYVAEATEQAVDYGQTCLRNTGALLGHVDTVSAARDLDVLRAALGQSSLNYLGFSYGTRLGATYAGLFADRVGAFVLDGAVDPSLSAEDMLVEQVAGFDQAVRSYLGSCVTSTACPVRGDVDQAAEQLVAIISSLDEHPLSVADGRQLGSSTMLTAISAALYARSQWSTLTTAIADVVAGDGQAAMDLVDGYYSRDANGQYADNSIAALQAVNCLDLPVDTSEGATVRLDQRLREASSIFGPIYADGTVQCAGWPVAATGLPQHITADGAAPIMVIGTTGDPATPYGWAQSLADQLSSGFLVTNVGEGHTAYSALASSCITNVVERFLISRTVPAADVRCT